MASPSRVGIKVFYSLLFLSVLETLVWSSVLFGAAAGAPATVAAQAYYARETDNLSTAAPLGRVVPTAPAVEPRLLALAYKAEGEGFQRALLSRVAAAASAASAAGKPQASAAFGGAALRLAFAPELSGGVGASEEGAEPAPVVLAA